MDELYQQLVKLGPAWTVIFVSAWTIGSIIFLFTGTYYRRVREASHRDTIALKESTISDLKIRIKELESDRNEYREKAHLNAQHAQSTQLKLAELNARPNVDTLAEILKAFQQEIRQFVEQQGKVNENIIELIKATMKTSKA